jgi:hypothetical protein
VLKREKSIREPTLASWRGGAADRASAAAED